MILLQSDGGLQHVRILIVNQYFRPDQAASAQRLTDLAEDLAREHDVTAIVARPSYGVTRQSTTASAARPVLPRLAIHRVPATTFPRVHAVGRLLNYVTYLLSALLAGVRHPRADVVLAASDPPLVSLVGVVLGLVHRAPFVHFMWDVQPEVAVAAGLIRRGVLARLMSWLNRAAVTRAVAVVVPTRAMARTAVSLGVAETRVHEVPHWEDLDVVPCATVSAHFASRHGLEGRFVVMYAGNHGLTQQLTLFVDVAARMRDLEDVRFVFLGDGAAKPNLVARIAALGLTNVTVLPYEPRESMADAFAAADVSLAPLASGLTPFMLPSKVYTILASARPVLAVLDRSSDVARMVEQTGCGCVVDPGDAEGIEARLRWFHANRDEAVAMGRRGRRMAETRFSRAVVTPQIVELLQSLDPWPQRALRRTP